MFALQDQLPHMLQTLIVGVFDIKYCLEVNQFGEVQDLGQRLKRWRVRVTWVFKYNYVKVLTQTVVRRIVILLSVK